VRKSLLRFDPRGSVVVLRRSGFNRLRGLKGPPSGRSKVSYPIAILI
jgi:hypothetical protein